MLTMKGIKYIYDMNRRRSYKSPSMRGEVLPKNNHSL